MKKFVALTILGLLCVLPAQGYCFIDYLFGGSAMSDSIGNNVIGDLRAWWTGNPVYNFNPYYSGGNQGLPGHNQNQAPNFQAMPQQSYAQPNQQPEASYYPPQAQQQYAYPPQQAMQQQVPAPQQQIQQAPRQTRQPARQPQARVQQPQQQQYYQAQPQQAYQQPQSYQQPQPQAYYQQPQPYYGQEQQPMPGNRFQTYQYEQEVPSE